MIPYRNRIQKKNNYTTINSSVLIVLIRPTGYLTSEKNFSVIYRVRQYKKDDHCAVYEKNNGTSFCRVFDILLL